MPLDDRLRTKLQHRASPFLRDGEMVEDGIVGRIGPGEVPRWALLVIPLLSWAALASHEGRLVLRTDHRILYLHTAVGRPSKMKELLGEWEIGEAPITIAELRQRPRPTIVELSGIEHVKRAASGPAGAVTEFTEAEVERMYVAQSTLEEMNHIAEFVQGAAGRVPRADRSAQADAEGTSPSR
jgi:hypothetical protein